MFLFGKSERQGADRRLMHFHRLVDERKGACSSPPAFTAPLYRAVKPAMAGSRPSTLSTRIPNDDSAFSCSCLMCSRPPHLRCPRWQHQWRGYLRFVLGAGCARHISDEHQRLNGCRRLLQCHAHFDRGFLREQDGTITTFSVGGASGPSRRASMPPGISPGSTGYRRASMLPGILPGTSCRRVFRKAFSGTPMGASSPSIRPHSQ